MNIFKRIFALFSVLILAISFTGCSSNKITTIEDIKERGHLILTTSADFEPFEYYEGDEIVGIDVDVAEKIAEKIGVSLIVNNSSFDALTLELKNNSCDIVAAGMSFSEERQKNVEFSDPYFNASQSVLVLKDSPIDSGEKLDGKKIGVQTGTTGDQYCTASFLSAEITRYKSPVDAVTDLINGKIDAVVVDDYPATRLQEINSDKINKLPDSLTNEEYRICTHKGNSELLELINTTLAELKQSGELDKIFSKYLSEEQ